MHCIKGYSVVEEISSSRYFRFCRGLRESDGLPVLLRASINGTEGKRTLEMLERDFLMTGHTTVRGAVPVLTLERSADSAALVMEDHGWIPLRSLIEDSREDVHTIAVEMARSLSFIHSSGIVHRNLHSESFMFCKCEKLTCGITGFEHSACLQLAAEMENPVPRAELEIATASPEALGLIPFQTDYRSDLYSLGIIFYEMFTGSKPFPDHDESDLVYAHIAREPVQPSVICGKISPGLSEIVMKLLLKDPDSRYQSAAELLRDIESSSDINNKSLPRHGINGGARQPLFTDRIYGREEEMRRCIEIYDSVKGSHARIILAGGQPGAGKTSFITQLMTKIIRPGGLHGHSKDNRHGTNIPHSGITAAFGRIIKQILTRSDQEISSWKDKFTAALGPNLSVITDVIPEFEIITGPQPPQPDTGNIEARNRFIISFRKFVQVLAGGTEPPVVFIDDIQWSDMAGLDLVSSLVTDADIKNILFICAYRDNEIKSDDPLFCFLNDMRDNKDYADFVNISGLSREATAEMVEDILGISAGGGLELGGYIFSKTAGNPYHIREYMKTIFSEGFLKPSAEGSWEWDITGMDRLPATESLASVLSSAIQTLDMDMKNILAASACSGWNFSPHLIAAVLRIPVSGVNVSLDQLAGQGYIVKVDDGYRFIHDRIRETAYELIPENERLKLHRRSGRLLFGMANDEAEIFYAVEQMNFGRLIISDTKERTDLASLNLEAGILSQKRTAFAAALTYLRTARELLPEDPWNREYELTGRVMKELARCESVNGYTDNTESIVRESVKHLTTDEEKAEFFEILIMQMNVTSRFNEATALSRYALSLLGVKIPVENINQETDAEMNILKKYIHLNGIVSLTGLTGNSDPGKILTMKIIWEMAHSTYFYNTQLTIYLTLKIMNLTILYGLSRETISACCCYIGIACSVFKDYDTALAFWKVAEEIMIKQNDRSYKAEICLKTANYLIPMIQHLRDSEPVNTEGYNAGYMSGEHLCSGYILVHIAVNSFHYGKELGAILSYIAEHITFSLRTNNYISSDVMLALNKTIRYLTGDIEDSPGVGLGPVTGDEKASSERISSNHVIFSQVSTFSLQVLFICGEFSGCLDIIHSIRDKSEAMDGVFTATEFNFYHSLTLAVLIPDVDKTTAQSYLGEIIANQKLMKKWADRCPENFLHKYLLVEAEISRHDRRISDAMSLYDRAIESARENRFIQNEALCNELAARFWFSQGKEDFAGLYLRKARSLYLEWGALRKVRIIDRDYPDLLQIRSKMGDYNNDLEIINRESAAVVRSLQAISGEIELDNLLHTLTRNILQFGGATRLVLMTEKSGRICVEAQGSLGRSDGEISSELFPSISAETFGEVPLGVIRYCWRTGDAVIVNDSTEDEMFHDDAYIIRHKPKSYICVKNNYGDTSVLAYLENALARYAFTSGKVEVLKLIAVQAAISLENARLYREKKESVKKLAELGEARDMLLRQYDEAQQRALQKRMDPHFLYNAVHTIHSLININPAEADRAVLLLGEMLHFFTDRSFEQLIPFSEEWRFIQLYLEFEKIRFPDTLWFFLEKKSSFEGIMIPPLTIQPLVENAIKHGLRKKATGGVVNISAVRVDEHVTVEVTDTGTGLNSDDLYSRSIGNILNRLRYNFDFADVTLSNREEGGVKATVKFSVRNAKHEG